MAESRRRDRALDAAVTGVALVVAQRKPSAARRQGSFEISLHLQQTEQMALKGAQDAADSGRSVGETVAAMQQIAEKVTIIEEIAYQTNLLVMSAGGYRFTDFLRVGVPLTLIMWGAFSWLLPTLYGL